MSTTEVRGPAPEDVGRRRSDANFALSSGHARVARGRGDGVEAGSWADLSVKASYQTVRGGVSGYTARREIAVQVEVWSLSLRFVFACNLLGYWQTLLASFCAV